MACSHFYLDAVLAVVDCGNVLRHLRPDGVFGFLRRRTEAERQLALADCLLLNKADTVDQAAFDDVAAAARELNSTAKQLRSTHADVPLDELLDLHAFSSAQWEAHVASLPPTDPLHAASVSCVSLHAEQPVHMERLQAWLQALVSERCDDLYRMKGVLHIAGYNERFVLHGVHSQVQGVFERPWAAAEVRSTSLVIIGHRLERRVLTDGFEAALEPTDGATCETVRPEEEDAEVDDADVLGGRVRPSERPAGGLTQRVKKHRE
jgi:G3E family GTPase